jgi:hypothetical protein
MSFIIFQLKALKPGAVSLGSTWRQPGVNLGSTWGRPGVNLGSIWGQRGVSLHRHTLAAPGAGGLGHLPIASTSAKL